MFNSGRWLLMSLFVLFLMTGLVFAQDNPTFQITEDGGKLLTCPDLACPAIEIGAGEYEILAWTSSDGDNIYYRLNHTPKGWVSADEGEASGDLTQVSEFFLTPEAGDYLAIVFADDFEGDEPLEERWGWWDVSPSIILEGETENHIVAVDVQRPWAGLAPDPLLVEGLEEAFQDDYSWIVEMQILDGDTVESEDVSYQLTIRVDFNIGHSIDISVNPLQQWAGIGYSHWEDEYWEELGGGTVNVSANAWNTIRADAIGDQFYMYVDDTFVAKAEKEDMTFGSVDISFSGGSTIYIDNVILRSLAESESLPPMGWTTGEANMRATPESGRVVNGLTSGALFYILDWTPEGDWVYVRKAEASLAQGTTAQGWVSTDLITTVAQE